MVLERISPIAFGNDIEKSVRAVSDKLRGKWSDICRSSYLEILNLINPEASPFSTLRKGSRIEIKTYKRKIIHSPKIHIHALFKPSFIFLINGEWHFYWMNFWKKHPLSSIGLSFFVTMARQAVFASNPELKGKLKFYIIDFGAPKGGDTRNISVIDADKIPDLQSDKLKKVLLALVSGIADGIEQVMLEKIKEDEDPDNDPLFH